MNNLNTTVILQLLIWCVVLVAASFALMAAFAYVFYKIEIGIEHVKNKIKK